MSSRAQINVRFIFAPDSSLPRQHRRREPLTLKYLARGSKNLRGLAGNFRLLTAASSSNFARHTRGRLLLRVFLRRNTIDAERMADTTAVDISISKSNEREKRYMPYVAILGKWQMFSLADYYSSSGDKR